MPGLGKTNSSAYGLDPSPPLPYEGVERFLRLAHTSAVHGYHHAHTSSRESPKERVVDGLSLLNEANSRPLICNPPPSRATSFPVFFLPGLRHCVCIVFSQKFLQVLQGKSGSGVPLLGGGRTVHDEGLQRVRVQPRRNPQALVGGGKECLMKPSPTILLPLCCPIVTTLRTGCCIAFFRYYLRSIYEVLYAVELVDRLVDICPPSPFPQFLCEV